MVARRHLSPRLPEPLHILLALSQRVGDKLRNLEILQNDRNEEVQHDESDRNDKKSEEEAGNRAIAARPQRLGAKGLAWAAEGDNVSPII